MRANARVRFLFPSLNAIVACDVMAGSIFSVRINDTAMNFHCDPSYHISSRERIKPMHVQCVHVWSIFNFTPSTDSISGTCYLRSIRLKLSRLNIENIYKNSIKTFHISYKMPVKIVGTRQLRISFWRAMCTQIAQFSQWIWKSVQFYFWLQHKWEEQKMLSKTSASDKNMKIKRFD